MVRFLTDRRGSIVPMFALVATMLFGFVGAAIDYSRANATRVALQAALDSTALMLSKDVDPSKQETIDALPGLADKYVRAQFMYGDARIDSVDAKLGNPSQGMFNLTVTASATVNTTVSRVLGQTHMTVGSSGIVSWGIKRLEVALVLDNTWSMNSNSKMVELKKAAHDMLSTLEKAGKKPDDIKVAIIPFDTTVNIGTGFKDTGWIDYSVKNIAKSDWKGCVIDRDQSNDVLDTPPDTTNFKTLYPAAPCGTLTDAMPLSNVWADLNSKVDKMTPSAIPVGYTNITIGLVWGWHALTKSQPFNQAQDPQPDLDKVIILLTDGDNTKNRWSNSQSAIDARTAAACANIKAANVKIYTVRVIDGNKDLLKSCASSPSMFYDVQQSSQLLAVFSSIAQHLANLRIVK